MSIERIYAPFQPIAPLAPKPAEKIQGAGAQPKAGASFSEMFMSAIKDVDQAQVNADKKIEDLMTAKNPVNTHDAMIALEKADIAFQLMNQVRSSIVRAYEEVIRTQV